MMNVKLTIDGASPDYLHWLCPDRGDAVCVHTPQSASPEDLRTVAAMLERIAEELEKKNREETKR